MYSKIFFIYLLTIMSCTYNFWQFCLYNWLLIKFILLFFRFFTKFTTRKPNSDNCNVNLAKLGKTYYAITDGPMCHRIDPETLDTTQFHDFNDKAGIVALCAHPHYGK